MNDYELYGDDYEERRKKVRAELETMYGVQPQPRPKPQAPSVDTAVQAAVQAVGYSADALKTAALKNQAASKLARVAVGALNPQPKPVEWQTRPYMSAAEEADYNGLTAALQRLQALQDWSFVRERQLEGLRSQLSAGQISREEYFREAQKIQEQDRANNPEALQAAQERVSQLEQARRKAQEQNWLARQQADEYIVKKNILNADVERLNNGGQLRDVGEFAQQQAEMQAAVHNAQQAALKANALGTTAPAPVESAQRPWARMDDSDLLPEEQRNTVSEFADPALYFAMQFGAGAASTPFNIQSGISSLLSDAVTGGRTSGDFQKIEQYFTEHPEARTSGQTKLEAITGQSGFGDLSLAGKIGVDPQSLKLYRQSTANEAVEQFIHNEIGATTPEALKTSLGQAVYGVGAQVVPMMFGMGLSSGGSESFLGSLMNGAKPSKALINLVKPNATTALMGVSSGANKYNQLAREYGSNPLNLVNALGTGYLEALTENLGGFTDAQSFVRMFAGNTFKNNLIKYLLSIGEEGLEEVINLPLEGLVDKATVEPDKAWTGTGGVFDLEGMINAGVQGSLVSALMGGPAMVSATVQTVRQTGQIKAGIETLTGVANTSLPAELRPNPPAAQTATLEDFNRYAAAVRQAIESHKKQVLAQEGMKAENPRPFSAPKNSPQAGAMQSGAVSPANANSAPVGTTEAGRSVIAPVKVGRGTVIQSPYQGKTPVYIKPADNTAPMVQADSLATASQQIASAKSQQSQTGKSFRNYLKNFYNNVFERTGGVREVTVNGLEFDGQPYVVTVNKNAVGKVISDPNITAEKLALFDVLNDVIQNGEYVGSGSYTPHGSRTKNVTRYDYFETPVRIGGKDYLATFDVEVIPGTNKYRTHKVINKIDLTSTADGEAGPVPAASAAGVEAGPVPAAPALRSSLSTPIIPIPAKKSNRGAMQNGAVSPANANSAPVGTTEAGRITLKEFTDNTNPVWNFVDYSDNQTKADITREIAGEMIRAGNVVELTDSDLSKFDQYYPDLRGMKKQERTPILREKIKEVKNYLSNMLKEKFGGKTVEFTVNGNVLEAKLHETGIKEVLEKVTQEKAAMIDKTGEIFSKAQYLYSTSDKAGNPNIYRWNYFYVPLKVGNDTYGVRVAVRDMKHLNESQIYNYGIKKDAVLPGGLVNGQKPNILANGHRTASTPIIPASSQKSNAEDVVYPQRSSAPGKVIMPGIVQTKSRQGTISWSKTEKDSVSNPVNAFEKKWGIESKVVKPSVKTNAAAFVKDGKIYLNADRIDSYSGAVSKLAHEAAHIVEGSEYWAEMKKAAAAYYRAVDPNLRPSVMREAIRERYKGVAELTVDQAAAEVVAGFMEDICAQDSLVGERAARILLEESPKGFQRVVEFLKDKVESLKAYLPVGTGLSKQQRYELQAAQRGLRNLERGLKAYRKGMAEAQQGTRYSIAKDQNGRNLVVVDTDQQLFDGKPKSEYAKIARRIINQRFKGQVLPLSAHDLARVTKKSAGEYAYPSKRPNPTENSAKMRASTELDNLLKVSEFLYHTNDTKNHSEATLGWDYYKTRFMVDGHVFEGQINIATSENGRVFYDITNIKELPSTYGMPVTGMAQSASTSGESLLPNSGMPVTDMAQSASTLVGEFSNTTIAPNAKGVNTSIAQTRAKDTKYKSESSTAGGATATAEAAQETRYAVTGNYDYTKSFAEQVEDYKQGKIPKGDTLLVCPTPEVLQKIGLNPLPMTINTTHVDYALNGTKDINHSLGQALISQLPTAIQNPAAVISSQTQGKTSLVVLLPIQHLGNTVIAPVYIDGFGRQNGIVIDSNAITSVFGKRNAVTKLLRDAIQEERNGNTAVFYYNKKIADPLLQVAGLQLPGGLIPRGGYIHSIRENDSKINLKFKNITETQQFKRWFGDWEKHPNTASKVVDKNGAPLVVYHGTPDGSFTVFDVSKSPHGARGGHLGDGYYFSPNPRYAQRFAEQNKEGGGRIIAAYLSLKNPYEAKYRFDVNGIGAMMMDLAAKNGGELDLSKGYPANHQMVQQVLKNYGYDGVIHRDQDGTIRMAVAFEPNQIKSATDNIGTYDPNNPDIRYSYGEGSFTDAYREYLEKKYSYEALTQKPDMKVTQIDTAQFFGRKLLRADYDNIVQKSLHLVRQKGNPNNTEKEVFVRNRDLGADIQVTKSGLKHGLDRRADKNIVYVERFGEILEQAVAVNQLQIDEPNVIQGHVLIGAARDSDHNIHVIRIIVKERMDGRSYVDDFEVLAERHLLYALDGKKTEAAVQKDPGGSAITRTASVISISKLLDIVKDYYPEILPHSVLEQYGIDRPESPFTGSLRYSYGEGSFTDAYRQYLEKKYSYEALTQKPDMKVTRIQQQTIPVKGKKLDAAKIANDIYPNIPENRNGTLSQRYVYVKDLGNHVLVNKKGIQHGLTGNKTNSSAMNTAVVSYELPEIIANSVKINELLPRNEQELGSDILFGYAVHENGDEYLVRTQLTVGKDNKSVTSSIDLYKVLKGMKAKKVKGTPWSSYTSQSQQPIPSVNIPSALSIAELLEIIKKNYPEFLPLPVAEHFGVDRPESPFSGSLRYSYGEGSFTDAYRQYLEKKYSYEALTQKPDMKVTMLTEKPVVLDTGRIDRAATINKGLKSLIGKDNGKNAAGRHYVYVNDIGEYVSVNRKAFEHGLSRQANATAYITSNLGSVLENSIKINELEPRNETVLSSYILLGAARDENGALYPVRFVVNEYPDGLSEITGMDVIHALYAAKAKKIEPAANAGATTSQKAGVPSGSVISIRDLLENIKGDELAASVLSNDVLAHLGIDRPESPFTGSLRYSYGEGSFTDYYLDYANRRYGTIPKGEKAYREVSVPRQTGEGTKTRRAVRTILEAESTPDSAVEAIKKDLAKEAYAYTPEGDKAALDRAGKTIRTRGLQGALDRWNAAVNGAVPVGKEMMALGETLMAEAGKSGDIELFQKLAAEIAAEATNAGQAVQAMKLIKKFTPEGHLYYVQKAVDGLQKKLNRRMKGKAPELELDPELAKKLLEARTAEEMETASTDILKSIAEQMPSTWQDKWDAWRYFAMLANPRTHIRNILGNTVFVPARMMKNGAVMLAERMVSPEERTQAFLTKADQPLREFAQQNFETVKDSLTSTGKMNPSNIINELRPIFTSKAFAWLEKLRKLNNRALEAEDLFFLKRAYVSSMAKAMKARGLDADFLQSGTREATVQLRALEKLAAQEALEATYRDASSTASALNHFKETNKATDIIGNALFPFTKTPVNVLKRGVEYSPIGLIKGVVDMTYGLKTGKKTAAEAIGSLCKGVSGLGIAALGYWLSSMGLLVAGAPEDDRERSFETLQGAKTYALKLGDVYYTIDWMAPVALPLFVGAEMQKATEGEGFSTANIIDSLTKISEPMFNLSMLDGLNSTFKSISYGSAAPLTDFAVEAAKDYITQALPTLGGQIARTIDPKARNSYYVDKNSPIPESVQELLNAAQAKIPFLSFFLSPKVDQWGRTTGKDNALVRAFENFISPGYISTRNETPVDKEIAEVYKETGESKVLPRTADKHFEVDGETRRLSAQEYTKYAQERGKRSFEYINQLLSNPGYQKLDPDEKAEVIQEMYQAANAEAKKEVEPDYDIPNTVVKAYEANKQAGILYGDYYLYKMGLESTPNQQEVIDALNRSGLTRAQKRYLFHQRFPNAKQKPFG